MSSESETKYSLEQLRQMNRKPETPSPITIQCPMDGEIVVLRLRLLEWLEACLRALGIG